MADDLDQKLHRALDEVPAPDLWSEAAAPHRPQLPIPSGPSTARRVAIAAFALLVFAAVASLVGVARTSKPMSSAPPSHEVTTSALVMGGAVRCTATVRGAVEPGDRLSITYSLQNVSPERREVSMYESAYPYEIKGADGSSFNTADLAPISVPYFPPRSLAPGDIWAPELGRGWPVQFPGPLTVSPGCLGSNLPPIHVAVAASPFAPAPGEAVARAADATPGLLDSCMPSGNTLEAVGLITPLPAGEVAPSMSARCTALVDSHDGFSVVTFLVVAQSDAGPVHVSGPASQPNLDLPDDETVAAILWRVVVTEDRSVVAFATTHDRSRSADRMVPSWDVSADGWHAGDQSRCGDEGYVVGGSAAVNVPFVGVCLAPSP